MMVLMPIAGTLYDPFGARWPAIAGILMTGSGILFLARINVDISEGELILGMCTTAGGLALGMMPITTAGLSVLPARGHRHRQAGGEDHAVVG